MYELNFWWVGIQTPSHAGAVKLKDFEWHKTLSVTFLIMLGQSFSPQRIFQQHIIPRNPLFFWILAKLELELPGDLEFNIFLLAEHQSILW